MGNKNITLKQALQITINGLLQINVPVRYTEQITDPINEAIDNLRQCIIAIDVNEQKAEETEETKPDEEVKPDGGV